MAEVIIFPKRQQRISSKDYIATTKRVLAKKRSKGPQVSVAALVQILPHTIRDLRFVLREAERDAQQGREGLAFLIGMYEHILDECRAMDRSDLGLKEDRAGLRFGGRK